MLRDHDSVPPAFRATPAGSLVTVEVTDAVAARAMAAQLVTQVELMGLVRQACVVAEGERHFIVADPDRLLVDVVEPIPPTGKYAEQYTDAARAVDR